MQSFVLRMSERTRCSTPWASMSSCPSLPAGWRRPSSRQPSQPKQQQQQPFIWSCLLPLEITITYLPSKEDYFRFLYNKENTVIRRSETFPMGLSVRQSVGLSVCHTASLSQFLKGTN